MELAGQVGAWMLVALVGYAVLGGADFGGGVLDLFARGPRTREQRQAVAQAMGPVWEANHVWLIFFFIIMFSAFPPAFRALGIAMFLPVNLVLAAIVLRGASFAFRSPGVGSERYENFWGTVFGVTSLIAPLGLGAALGAVSIGGIRLQGNTVLALPTASWLSLFSLSIGVLSLAMCSYLAAVYLTMETRNDLQEDFRRRALYAGSFTTGWSAVVLLVMAFYAPFFWEHFNQSTNWLVVAVGFLIAVGSLYYIWARKYAIARVLTVLQLVALLGGWALAQWPYLIAPDLTMAQAASPVPMLRFMLTVIPIGVVIVLPALAMLFAVFKRQPAPTEPSVR